MSFASPLWLVVLLAVPPLLLAYLYSQRRVHRYAVRFPAIETLRTAAAFGGSQWRRHVPAGLLLLAVTALALALARPQHRYRLPIDQGSIMLVTDHSGSMAASDVLPDRLDAAEKAANQFIDRLPAQVKVGAVAFSSSPDAVQGPSLDHAAARQIIDTQQPNGTTATGNALALALQLLQGANRHHSPAAIVLLSDGAANAGTDPATVAQAAKQERIPIYTVALGTPGGIVQEPGYLPQSVPPDPALMQQIARFSGGRSFGAQDAGTLSSIYRALGDKLGSVAREQDITFVFALIGLALVAVAAALATRVAGRLP